MKISYQLHPGFSNGSRWRGAQSSSSEFRLLFPEIVLLFQGTVSGLDMQPASESQPAPSISAGALRTGVEGREGT
ncbi:hypothetical protein [Novosphingobium sp. NBM11]|uniref:hypothetical protein n=1 Tax=Novosphingobium sp. NBM11 TaxID=2596914 RepID=UPI0018925F89|nr:hypothetical protein [Novosphingobium sp. NBM11]